MMTVEVIQEECKKEVMRNEEGLKHSKDDKFA
jgi:hypothetical protein